MSSLKLYALLLCCAISPLAWGQRCGYTDTIRIDGGATVSVPIQIDGFTNTSLDNPSQAVCGVSVYFQHSYVYDFTLTLTSPAGQSVQLIGPVQGQTRPNTNLTRWFVDFLRTSETALPDLGLPGRWNNNMPQNWVLGRTYSGSYHPANGNLEDFNTGPVNGTWTFELNTARQLEAGQVTYLFIDFCDDDHVEGPCCNAYAGDVRTLPFTIEACEDTPDFPVPVLTRFDRPRADAAEYDYTFVIARDSAIVATQDNPNLANQPAGLYEICGLSYRIGELGNLPVDGSVTLADLRADFASSNPNFCGDLTPSCQTVRLYPIRQPTELAVTICEGSSYFYNGTNYFTDRVHTVNLVGQGGCDSTVLLDLTVIDEYNTVIDTVICAEAVFSQAGNIYDTPGIYRDTVSSLIGCDSILTLNLAFRAPITNDTTVVLCKEDSFMIGNESFSAEGFYQRVLPAINGCDSTINLNIRVINTDVRFTDNPDSLTCDITTIELDASNSFLNGVNVSRRSEWTDINGTLLNPDNLFARRLQVDTGGLYFFTLVDQDNLTGKGCTDVDSVRIADARFEIDLEVALTQVQCNRPTEAECAVLNCFNPTLSIAAIVGPLGPDYRYTWSASPGGNIVSATNGPEIVVDAPGTYTVRVEDDVTGCFQVDSLRIGIDNEQPDATILGTRLLNCAVTETTLVADTLQANSDSLDYIWTGDCLPAPVRAKQITLNCTGSVTLNIINRVNGCSDTQTVSISRDLSPSVISLAPATAPLTCAVPERRLDASGSFSNNGQLFFWTYGDQPDTIGTADQLIARRAGTYYLTAIDQRSRCLATDSIVVPADTIVPTAISGPDELRLDCYTPTQILGGDTSVTRGPDIRYAWVDLNSPQDTISRNRRLLADVNGGLYQYTVLDVGNGCFATDITRVVNRLDTPRIFIQPPFQFECFIDSVTLDASSTDLSFDYEIRWSGPCLPDRVDTSVIDVFCPGTYYLDLINLETGCTDRDTVEVLLGPNSVVAVLPDTALIDCDTREAMIDRSFGTDAPVVRWLRDGQPVDLFGQRPTVTVPGLYTLILGNFDESCLDTAQIVVTADCPALSVIVPPDSLTCDSTIIHLDATVSFPVGGINASTEWLIPPGASTLPTPNDRVLRVITPGSYGFVITNLVSGEADTTFVEVKQNIEQPLAVAGRRDTVNCYTPTVTLNAAGSTEGPLMDYRWTNAGGVEISDSLTAQIDVGGVYLFEVEQRETGCRDVANVIISQDRSPPEISLTSAVIPCDTFDFKLAVLTQTDEEFSYEWFGPNIIAGRENDTVRISDVGTYSVRVTRTRNGCPASVFVEAERLPCPPFPRLRDTSLSCVENTINLETTFRDPCEGCTYTWRRNGTIIPGENGTTLNVREQGEYAIVAINRFGLVGTDTATVTDSRFVPLDNAGPDQTLSCTVTEVLLWNPAPEPNFNFEYTWIAPDGNPIMAVDTDSIRVSRGGLYRLASTNLFSNCTIIDTVIVRYDTVSPVADAGPDQLLDCNNKRRIFNGLNSSLGRQYVYRWTGGPSPACLEGSDNLNPLVRCNGDYVLTVIDTLNGCRSSSRVRVDIDEALPVVIPLLDTTITCANRALDLVGNDISRPNVRYFWERESSGENEMIAEVRPGVITVDTASNYRFYIQDTLNGCDNEFSVRVNEDLVVPDLAVSPSDTFYCELDSLLILGNATGVSPDLLTYQWRSATGFFVNNDQGRLATVFQPDTYYFTATNARNSCTATDSVVLFRDVRAPIAEAGEDGLLTCTLRTVDLNGLGTSNSGQQEYRWSTMSGTIIRGGTSATATAADAGSYLLTVIDPVNGCTGSDIVFVNQDTVRPVANIVDDGDLLLNCFRPSLNLNRSLQSRTGSAVSGLWIPPARDTLTGPADAERLTVISRGRYALVATDDGNGCRDTAAVIVVEDFVAPSVRVPPPQTLSCSRDSVILTATNPVTNTVFRYQWLNLTDSLVGRGRQAVIRAEGDYRVVTQSLTNGCRDTTLTRVGGDFEEPESIIIPPLTLNCSRGFTALDGRGSSIGPEFVVDWRGPETGMMPSDDPYLVRGRAPGRYYLTVTNEDNGCTQTDSVELIQEAIQIESLEVAVEQPACVEDRDGAVQIMNVNGGAPPFLYRLDGGLLTNRLEYDALPIGRYVVEVFGSDGCSTETNFEIVEAQRPSVTLRPDTTINLGDSVLLDFVTSFVGYDTILWTSSGRLPDSLGNGPIIVSPLQSQTYRLVVQDEEGCRATATVVIEVNGRVNVYVPTAFTPNGDNTNDLMRPYAGPQVQRLTVFRIFDRWGELLYDLSADPARNTDTFGWDGRLNGRLLNPQNLVWELEVELIDGSIVRQTGDFILMR